MILIQRYIFKELLYNFFFTFVVITMIMVLVISVKIIFQFQLMGIMLILKLLPLMLVQFLMIIIPAAVLVSTVMTYGRVASDNELTTMKAGGINVLRIIVPGIVFGLLGTFCLLVVNDRLVPMAERKVKAIKNRVNVLDLLDMGFQKGKRQLSFGELDLSWDECEKRTLAELDFQDDESMPQNLEDEAWIFSGLRIRKYNKDDDKALQWEGLAESGVITSDDGGRTLNLWFFNGRTVVGDSADLKQARLRISLPDGKASKVRLSMRPLAALAAMLDREPRYRSTPNPHKVEAELHKRIANSFGPLVFVLLSLPVALIFRQQNRMVAFLISIVLALFIYYPVSILGEALAKDGTLTPYQSIWPGTGTLALLGLLLILKVTRR